MEFSLFLPLFLFYLVFTFLLGGIASKLLPAFTLNGSTVLLLLCTALCFSVFTQLIFSFAKNAGRGLLLLTFLGLLMILVAGGFLPYAFLPKGFPQISSFLPLATCLTGLRKAIGGTPELWDILLPLFHAAILFGLLILLSLFRRKEVRS